MKGTDSAVISILYTECCKNLYSIYCIGKCTFMLYITYGCLKNSSSGSRKSSTSIYLDTATHTHNNNECAGSSKSMVYSKQADTLSK